MAKTRKSEGPDETPVHLKPILGIPPKSYLPVVYALALLVLLFFLLLYPGIRDHGTDITIRSNPPGAEVVIDERRVGATPTTVFVPSGERKILLRYPGFRSEEISVRVEGRLFGSLLFPRQRTLQTELTPTAPQRLALTRAEEFAAWALAGGGSAAFPVPPILGETGRVLGAFPEDPNALAAGSFLLENGKLQLSSSSQLKDLSRGTVLFHGLGGPSPLGLSRSLLDLIHPAKDAQSSKSFAALLARALPSELLRSLESGRWYADHGGEGERREGESQDGETPRSGSSQPTAVPEADAGDRSVPEGVTVEGMSFAPVDDAFLMLRREVSRGDYATFLMDNPGWRADVRGELLEAGVVTEDYLADWGAPRSADEPIRFVSWYAAEAFAAWLDSRLRATRPALAESWEVRLPRSREWSRAAALEAAPGSDGRAPRRVTFEADGETPYPVAPERMSEAGFYDLYGNLWEWSGDWFTAAPEAEPLVSLGREEIVGAERIVQGGSFANSERELSGSLRGSQPPAWCTPYLGFRLVIAPREEQT